MARKTVKEAALTRQKILSASAQVFCRDGIAGARLEAIAQAAQVTRGAIYWHFSGKQELLQTLLDEQSLPLERDLLSGHDLRSGWMQLRCALEETLHDDLSRQLSKIMLHKSERLTDESPVTQRLLKIRQTFVAQLFLLLHQGMQEGTLPANLDVEQACDFFQSCIAGLLFDCLQGAQEHPQRLSATLDTLQHLLLHPPVHWIRPG